MWWDGAKANQKQGNCIVLLYCFDSMRLKNTHTYTKKNLFKGLNLQICFPDVFVRAADWESDGGRFLLAYRNNIPNVRLGLRPTLLAKRWPFSLGISNLHNLCWLLLTGLSHARSAFIFSGLETWWKRSFCKEQKWEKLKLADGCSCYHSDAAGNSWWDIFTIPMHTLNSRILQHRVDKTNNDLVCSSSVFVLPGASRHKYFIACKQN